METGRIQEIEARELTYSEAVSGLIAGLEAEGAAPGEWRVVADYSGLLLTGWRVYPTIAKPETAVGVSQNPPA